mmetsp:Transcript_129924/g.308267  ORF Transcript_129924/g.308267 Transcript_129924/m.308267 type:complete len:301 (-) Transcript_129924:476-1378(-)
MKVLASMRTNWELPDLPPAVSRSIWQTCLLSSLYQRSRLRESAPAALKLKWLHSSLPPRTVSTPSKSPVPIRGPSLSMPGCPFRSTFKHRLWVPSFLSSCTAMALRSSTAKVILQPDGPSASAARRSRPLGLSTAKFPRISPPEPWPESATTRKPMVACCMTLRSGGCGTFTMIATSPVNPRISRTAKSCPSSWSANRVSSSWIDFLCIERMSRFASLPLRSCSRQFHSGLGCTSTSTSSPARHLSTLVDRRTLSPWWISERRKAFGFIDSMSTQMWIERSRGSWPTKMAQSSPSISLIE